VEAPFQFSAAMIETCSNAGFLPSGIVLAYAKYAATSASLRRIEGISSICASFQLPTLNSRSILAFQ
jgi:hypothetical protein